jgi:hypothetical protein
VSTPTEEHGGTPEEVLCVRMTERPAEAAAGKIHIALGDVIALLDPPGAEHRVAANHDRQRIMVSQIEDALGGFGRGKFLCLDGRETDVSETGEWGKPILQRALFPPWRVITPFGPASEIR